MTREITYMSQIQHIVEKSMWAGGSSPSDYILTNGEVIQFIPKLAKMIDESLVNVADHAQHFPTVKKCHVTYGNGIISVSNDGPGFNITKVKNADGKEIYSVEMAFSICQSGDNFKNQPSTKGGTNGLGLKIIAALSSEFKIETFDETTCYTQHAFDNLQRIEPPTLTPNTKKQTGTKITFRPMEILNTEDSLMHVFMMDRIAQISATSGLACWYNGSKVGNGGVKSFENFALSYIRNYHDVETYIPHKFVDGDGLKWEVFIVLTPSESSFNSLLFVNNIYVQQGGPPRDKFHKIVIASIKEEITRQLKKQASSWNARAVSQKFRYVMNGLMFNPQWDSQTKTTIKCSETLCKFPAFTEEFTKTLFKLVPPIVQFLIESQKGKSSDSLLQSMESKRGGIFSIEKFYDANYAGHRRHKLNKKCSLLVCEGDSAMGTVRTGITKVIGSDCYGCFSIQGVPQNGLRESVDTSHGKRPTQKFLTSTSNRLTQMMTIIDLKYSENYDFTEKGEAEFKSLRYDYICAVVDQDEDGKGNIFGLLLAFIITYWPNLVKRGFVRRLNTPVVRMRPNSRGNGLKILEFFSEPAHEKFVKENPDVTSKYTTIYYKGLGTHDESIWKEVSQIFKNYDTSVITYTYDEHAFQTIQCYYGADTAPRKIELSKPLIDEIHYMEQRVSVSDQLNTDTKRYQLYNLERKLPRVDGLVLSRRKVVHTALKNPVKLLPVNAMVARVIDTTEYKHGHESLEKTVFFMSQMNCHMIPLLIGEGNFGTKNQGYTNVAGARYIKTKANTKVLEKLFPSKDAGILKYVESDSAQLEPENYHPIVPYVLLENFCLPGNGWKVEIWARKWKDVVDATKLAIRWKQQNDSTPPPKISLTTDTSGFKGEIRFGDVIASSKLQREYSVGNYRLIRKPGKPDIVVVTELGFGQYEEKCIGNRGRGETPSTGWWSLPNVIDILPKTNDTDVLIELSFEEGTVATWTSKSNYLDPVESTLEIYTILSQHLNLTSNEGAVISFDSYQDVFWYWFEQRHCAYVMRRRREEKLRAMQIEYLQSKIRFIRTSTVHSCNCMTYESLIETLECENYKQLYHSALSQCTQDIEEIYHAFYNGKNISFDYLTNITVKQRTETEVKKLESALNELVNYREVSIYDEWIAEIEELEVSVEKGCSTGWSFTNVVCDYA
jgi:DNA gyrase/topoisomerase IV subunit B